MTPNIPLNEKNLPVPFYEDDGCEGRAVEILRTGSGRLFRTLSGPRVFQ